jgi:aspartyl-tRNA synthetase
VTCDDHGGQSAGATARLAGTLELVAEQLTVLNAVTRPLPFLVGTGDADDEPPREELRLRHRVLDLRSVGSSD